METEREDERDPERGDEPEAGQLQQSAAELLELDLEASEQKQEREPQQAHQLHRLVHLRPAEYRWSQHDAEHDLEHDCRKPQRRHEPERERRRERSRRDDQQVREVDLHLRRHGDASLLRRRLHAFPERRERVVGSAELVDGNAETHRDREPLDDVAGGGCDHVQPVLRVDV